MICKKCLFNKYHFTAGICTDCFHDKYKPKREVKPSDPPTMKNLKKLWEARIEWKNKN
jgi:hypothetical protein